MRLSYNTYLEKDSIFQARYSFWALAAIYLALAEAFRKRTNDVPAVGTSLLLLGIMAEGEGLGYRVLSSKRITLKKIVEGLKQIFEGVAVWPVAGVFGYTYGADRPIEFALDEADRLGHKYIGTEHLLLGIIHDIEMTRYENGPRKGAVIVLERLGLVDFRGLKKEILDLF